MKIAGVAFLIAFPVTLVILNFMLTSFDEKISLWNPVFWMGMLVIIGGFIFITVFHRMWRIAHVVPAEIIKRE